MGDGAPYLGRGRIRHVGVVASPMGDEDLWTTTVKAPVLRVA